MMCVVECACVSVPRSRLESACMPLTRCTPLLSTDGDTLAPPPSHRGPGTASDANNPFPVNDRIEMGKATIRHVGVKPATKLGVGSGEGEGSSPGSEGGDSPKGKLRMRSFGDDILARSNPLLVTAGGLEASRLEQLSKYRMAGCVRAHLCL